MNLNLYKEYDIVTKYGCFDYEFFIIISVVFVILYTIFNDELK